MWRMNRWCKSRHNIPKDKLAINSVCKKLKPHDESRAALLFQETPVERALRVLLTNLLQQSLRRILHHIQHALETIRAAVIRIRHFALRIMTRIFEEQPRLGIAVRRSDAMQNGEVGPVHRQ